MCGGIKIELLRFQLNQSGHSEYDSEYVDIEGDDENTQGGMVRFPHWVSYTGFLDVYGCSMTV